MEFFIDILESLYFFIVGFLGNKTLPNTMQGAGIVATPLLIYLMSIAYHKDESGNVKDMLENHILLNIIFPIKNLIIIILGIYGPFLLWYIQSARIILFIISAISIFILFSIIHNIIRWTLAGAENDIDGDVDNDDKNYKNKLIKKVFTSIEESDKVLQFYTRFLGKKYTDNQAYIEEKYFDYFLEYLDKIYEKEKNQQSVDLYQYTSKSIFMKSLRTYNELMINRNLSNPYLLRHFTKKWIERFFKYYDKEDGKPGKIYEHTLIAIIEEHMKAYCKLDNKLEWHVLISLIKNGMKDKEKNKAEKFLKYFVIDIFLAEPKIWQGNLFPEEWKVKIVEKENAYALQWLDAFWNKNLQNPRPYNDGYDIEEAVHQQSILEGLFVDKIDPEIFSYFYRIIDPYDNIIINSNFYRTISPEFNSNNYEETIRNNYMKWLVEEHKHDFYNGMKKILATTISYSSSSSKPTQKDHLKIEKDAIKRMEQATFKIFWGYYRYPSLQKPAVKNYINQLHQLSYDEEKNPYELRRKEILLHILDEWLKYCDKKDKEKKDKEKSVKQLVVKE